MRHFFVFLLIGFSIVASGCDYGSYGEDGNDEGDGIVITQALTDFTMGIRDEPKINLSTYFESESGLPVSVTAFSLGEVIAVDLSSSVLSISPIKVGVETVTVVASRPGVDPVEASFQVEVLCPIEAGQEEVDFFPLETGREWQYDYHVVSFSEDNPVDPEFEQVYTGTLTWVVSRFDESCSSAEFTIQESFEGTFEKRHPETGEVKDQEPSNWSRESEGTIDGTAMTWPGYIDLEIPRIRDIESDDRLTYTLAVVGGSIEAVLEKGVGLVEFHREMTGTRSYVEIELTIMR